MPLQPGFLGLHARLPMASAAGSPASQVSIASAPGSPCSRLPMATTTQSVSLAAKREGPCCCCTLGSKPGSPCMGKLTIE
ncbi:hypothetical protein U9M48_004080 [Paspalum notatum var. saurae]|uniref:Uncharacterized protein n=1 Tax=Paspalum notatum var. saurae TaxID=547442 RepID=A0AAQ3PPB1_PASNO